MDMEVGVIGKDDAERPYLISILEELPKPIHVILWDIYKPFLIPDVLNEGYIKIRGHSYSVQLSTPSDNPMKKATINYTSTFDELLFVIDGKEIKDSINYLKEWADHSRDEQIKAVVVTDTSKQLEDCLKFCKEINSSYMSLLGDDGNEYVVYSSGKEIPPVKVRVGGAITVPFVNKVYKEHHHWLENVILKSYSRVGLI